MGGTIRVMSIHLEPWTEDDLPLVQALLGDPVMMEYLGGPEDPDKIVERHGRYVDTPNASRSSSTASAPAGSASGSTSGRASRSTRWAGRSCPASRAAAWHPRARGSHWRPRGRATARASCTRSRPGNGPSNAICRKCGFTLLGEVRVRVPEGPLGDQQRLGPPSRRVISAGSDREQVLLLEAGAVGVAAVPLVAEAVQRRHELRLAAGPARVRLHGDASARSGT